MENRLRSICAFMLASLSLLACETVGNAGSPSSSADALLSRVLDEDGGAGAMAAVVRDGAIIWSGAAGSADIEQGVTLRSDSRLRIGSVSKTLASALALRMAMAGEFDLDADIRVYVPEAPERTPKITPKLLAAHLSGIRHFDFTNFYEANNVIYRPTLADGLSSFINDPLHAPPGAEFNYSSHGYDLLGAALERAGGATYAALFARHVAGPFGLRNTTVDHPFDIIERRARFYTVTFEYPAFGWTREGDLVNTVVRDGSDYYPSGGMLSTAEDLAIFASRFFESALIDDDVRALALEPAHLSDGRIAQDADGDLTVDISFGWRIARNADGSIDFYGHNGETNGGYALLRYYPAEKLAIAAVANYNAPGRNASFFELIGEDLPLLFRRKRS